MCVLVFLRPCVPVSCVCRVSLCVSVCLCVCVLVSVCLCASRGAHQGELLRLHWRRRIVMEIHELYFQRPAAYFLNNMNGEVDNPDQRVTQE